MREKIRTILGNWIRILSFVNTLANSSGVNKRMRGKNVTGGCFTIIERLRRSSRIASEKWNPSFQPSFAAATPGFFERRYMKFTFRGFSGGMPTLQLTFLE